MSRGSPINDVFQMRKRGVTNNEIIQNLQRQGYSNTQIFDAMNQADTKMAVEGNQNLKKVPEEGLFKAPPPNIVQPQPEQQPESMEQQVLNQPRPRSSGQIRDIFEEEEVKVEELVETIIEEKWEELVEDVNKIVDWKNRVENRITDMEVDMKNLKDNYSDLHKAILGKVNDYDKHILEIGSNIKAMEKVFSKVLPRFTENVNELSKIANDIKGKK